MLNIYNLTALRTTTSKIVLLLGPKKLGTHVVVVVVFLVVILDWSLAEDLDDVEMAVPARHVQRGVAVIRLVASVRPPADCIDMIGSQASHS